MESDRKRSMALSNALPSVIDKKGGHAFGATVAAPWPNLRITLSGKGRCFHAFGADMPIDAAPCFSV